MKKKTAPLYCIGVDIAAASFVASALHRDGTVAAAACEFSQNGEGFKNFCRWISTIHRVKRSILIVMETTGNFNHKLCYYLYEQNYKIAVADAFRISRSDRPNHPKNDRADSRVIAAYGMRHFDQLSSWKPANPLLIRINKLLATRELLVRMNTMSKNQISAMRYDVHQQLDLCELLRDDIAQRDEKIHRIEKLIIALINEHPGFRRVAELVRSIPACDWLMAANLLVITDGQTGDLNHRKLANYLGIAPHEFSSGSSVRKRAHSSRLGPPRMRKLLYLASWTLRTHYPDFRDRYEKMVQRGKPKKTALNASALKLLKIICAVLKNDRPYDPKHVSVNPGVKKS
jgi:transposase